MDSVVVIIGSVDPLDMVTTGLAPVVTAMFVVVVVGGVEVVTGAASQNSKTLFKLMTGVY